MNATAFLQKDYENEPPSGPKKTNPISIQKKLSKRKMVDIIPKLIIDKLRTMSYEL